MTNCLHDLHLELESSAVPTDQHYSGHVDPIGKWRMQPGRRRGANRLPSTKADWSANHVFQQPTSKKIGFATKGERHTLLHIYCSAPATVDVVSSPQNNMRPSGLITLTFELSDGGRHLAITE